MWKGKLEFIKEIIKMPLLSIHTHCQVAQIADK